MTDAEEYHALAQRLIAVETKLDILLGQLTGTHRDHEDRIRALESRKDVAPQVVANAARIRALEQWRWLVTGAVAAGSSVIGAVLNQLLGS